MMKKLVAMVLNWYKRGAKMEICEAETPQCATGMLEETRGKSNEEIGTPRKAIETPETAIGAPDGGSERRDDTIFSALPVRLGRMMTALGARRIHTEYGNVYRLVRLKDASRG